MQVAQIHIDEYGPFRQLDLDFETNAVNVLHGLNGAGKTMLLRFVRDMLYALEGVEISGRLTLIDRDGRRTVTRRRDGSISVTDADGKTLGGWLNDWRRTLPREQFEVAFAVGRPEAHAFERLLETGDRLGVVWGTTPGHDLDRIDRSIAEAIRTREHRETEIERLLRELDRRISEARGRSADENRIREDIARLESQLSRNDRDIESNGEHRSRDAAELERIEKLLRDTPRSVAVPVDLRAGREQFRRLSDLRSRLHENNAALERARATLSDITDQLEELTQRIGDTTVLPVIDERSWLSEDDQWLIDAERRLSALRETLNRARQASSREHDCGCNAVRDEFERLLRETTDRQEQWRSRHLLRTEGEQRRLWIQARNRTIRAREGLKGWIETLKSREGEILSELKTPSDWKPLRDWLIDRTDAEDVRQTMRWFEEDHRLTHVCPDWDRLPSERPTRINTDLERWEEERRKLLAALSRWEDEERRLRRDRDDLNDRLSRFRSELHSLRGDARIAEWERERQDLLDERGTLGDAERRLRIERDRLAGETRKGALSRASHWLARLTHEDYVDLAWDARSRTLSAIRPDGIARPVSTFSRGTADLVALSLRLACWEDCASRGIRVPLILDDVLTDCDVHRAAAATDVLGRVGDSPTGSDGQIIYMTCQQHLTDQFERRGVTVQHLPRPVPGPPTDPERSRDRRHDRDDTVTLRETRSDLDRSTIRLRTSDTLNEARPTRETEEEVFSETEWLTESVFRLHRLSDAEREWMTEWDLETMEDLLAIDDDDLEQMTPSESLRSSLRTRQWEADWLSEVPTMTAEDASALVQLGFDPEDLNEDDDLWERISRSAADSKSDRTRSWGKRLSRSQSRSWSRSRRGSRRSGTRRSRRSWNRSRSKTQSTRTRNTSGRRESSQSESATKPLRFHLHRHSHITDAPSIGPKTASRLKKLKVRTVDDLLAIDPESAADTLNTRHITATTIRDWQSQAELMCQVPEMRCHDVQILVACDIRDARGLAAWDPQALLDHITPFCESSAGERIIRSGAAPDLEEVTDWIGYAGSARSLADAA